MLQLEDVQFLGREMLLSLCGEFPEEDFGQARGDLCEEVCREILEAFHAGQHALRRIKSGCPHPRLSVVIGDCVGLVFTHEYLFV